ncbi:MAG: hypothetical protein ACOYOQ_12220 [Microthrixaceae bacterium]
MNAPTASPTARSTRFVARRGVTASTAKPLAAAAWPAKSANHDGDRFGHYRGHRTSRRGGTPH